MYFFDGVLKINRSRSVGVVLSGNCVVSLWVVCWGNMSVVCI